MHQEIGNGFYRISFSQTNSMNAPTLFSAPCAASQETQSYDSPREVPTCYLFTPVDPTSCLSKLSVIISLSKAIYHLFILPELNWIMSSSLQTDKDAESARIFNTSIDLTMPKERGCPKYNIPPYS